MIHEDSDDVAGARVQLHEGAIESLLDAWQGGNQQTLHDAVISGEFVFQRLIGHQALEVREPLGLKAILLGQLQARCIEFEPLVFAARQLNAEEFLKLADLAADQALVECSPKTEPGVMRESGAERRRNSHETEKTHTGRSHQKAA